MTDQASGDEPEVKAPGDDFQWWRDARSPCRS